MHKISLFIISIFFTISTFAQNVIWNFGTGSTANENPSTNTATNVAVSALTRGNISGASTGFAESSSTSTGGYSGASGEYNAPITAKSGSLTTTASGSVYFQFTLTPDANYTVLLSAISFGTRSTGTGPTAYTLRSSLDNYGSDVAMGTLTANSTWELKSHSGITVTSGVGTAITFRMYGYNGSGSGSNNWRIDDLSLILSTSSSSAPTTTATTTNFNGAFGSVNVGTSSSTSSFTVSGNNLAGNITITPPSGGFEIRTGSNPFSTSPINLSPASGSVSPTSIDVRFTPATTGAKSGDIAITSSGATSKTVAVSGTGVQPTKLSITTITPATPTVNSAFSATVQSQDAGGTATNVLTATSFSLSVSSGTGVLSGTVSGTIAAGTNQVIISGILYNKAENNVILTATQTSGDALTAGNSAAFNVQGVATQLAFVGFPATGTANSSVTGFTVEARRADNSVDGSFTGNITLSIASGSGNLSGTLTKAAVSGVATFNDVKFDAAGNYTLNAAATGLPTAISSTVSIMTGPVMNELVVPQYMGSRSSASGNNSRIPFAFCLSFDNLTANTTYNLAAALALTSDASSSFGAGNVWTGSAFANQSVTNAFTTNATGSSGPVWVQFEATNNAGRFSAGQVHNLRVAVHTSAAAPGSPQFIGTKTVTALDIASTALTGATTDDGGFIKGQTSAAFSGKYILTYDNETGTGNPISVYQVRVATATSTASNTTGLPIVISDIITQSGSSAVGDFAVVFPIGANNANGLRRVEIRNADNTLFNAFTTSNGIWNTTTNTAAIVRREVQTINLLAGTVNNLIVNNSFSLSGTMTIGSNLTLNNGVLTTTTANILKLATTASVSGGSSTSYIDGPATIATNATSAKLLPIVKAGVYKPVTIAPTNANASEYTAEYFATAPPSAPLESRIKAYLTSEYWQIDRTAGTAPAKVSLNYNSSGTTWSNGTSPTVSDVISIVHLRSSNNTWTQEYGTNVPSNTATATLTTNIITDFSPFTFGYGSSVALPVVISSFTATKTSMGNVVNWKTTDESSLNQYVVERSNGNTLDFKTAAIIMATNAGSYSFTDAPAKGYNYYRLKLIDKDNRISYSKTILIINDTKGVEITNLYPTIAKSMVRLESYAAAPVRASVRIVNSLGQTVHSQSITFSQAATTSIDVSRIARGSYLVQVIAEGYKKTFKFVKE